MQWTVPLNLWPAPTPPPATQLLGSLSQLHEALDATLNEDASTIKVDELDEALARLQRLRVRVGGQDESSVEL